VIVVDRLVGGPARHGTSQSIERIVAEGDGRHPVPVAQVLSDSFANDRGDTRSPPARFVTQLLVRLGGQPKIGRRVPSHDMTISRYRNIVNRAVPMAGNLL